MPRYTSQFSSVVLQDYIRLFNTSNPLSRTPSISCASPPLPPLPKQPQTPTTPGGKNTQISFDLERIISNQSHNGTQVGANYADVGRLATLVCEMDLLRKEVDCLIVDSHVNPAAKAMFPQWSTPNTGAAGAVGNNRWSANMQSYPLDSKSPDPKVTAFYGPGSSSRPGSRPGSRAHSRSRSHNRRNSRTNSWGVQNRPSSKVGPPVQWPARPELARSRSSERWQGGCSGSRGKGPDPGSMV